MNVGNSVRKAINDWQLGEVESAMLHACNAIDGTAKKVYPTLGSKARFTRLLRDNYTILGPMGVPGVNLVETRFPVTVVGPTAEGDRPDIADVIYGMHRVARMDTAMSCQMGSHYCPTRRGRHVARGCQWTTELFD